MPSSLSKYRMMDSTHSGATHGDPDTLANDGSFTMDFEVNIIEDIAKEIENTMRLGTVGMFWEARDLSKATVEQYLDDFPILAEFLRLLYHQGDYDSLGKNVDNALEIEKNGAWNEEQNQIMSLFKDISQVHYYGFSANSFRSIRPYNEALLEISKTALTDLREEQVFTIVLLLELRYLEHEFRGGLSTKKFSFWQTKDKDEALCPLTKHLLQKGRYWAAENILRFCFRKPQLQSPIKYARLWASIDSFATVYGLATTEEELWAKIGLLQTFCEGLLRRSSATVKIRSVHAKGIEWSDLKRMLSELSKLLRVKCDNREWENSRTFRRHCLITLDKKISDNNTLKSVALDDTEGLQQLRDNAKMNHDIEMLCVINWRISVLGAQISCDDVPTPGMTVPYKIYKCRQKLLADLQPAKRDTLMDKMRSLRLWANPWDEVIYDEYGVSKMSAGRQNSYKPSELPIKRILLLGHTGAGKSTLLRTMTKAWAATSNSPISCTSDIQRESCQWRDIDLECIDTPGFGDARDHMTNDQVLRRIANFLAQEFSNKRRIHSVFYLLNVRKGRVDESVMRQAKVFEALLGQEIWKNVCFIFTHVVSKDDSGPGTENDEKNQSKYKRHMKRDVFNRAKDNGAMFCDLGLDFSDYRARVKNEAKTLSDEPLSEDDGSDSDDVKDPSDGDNDESVERQDDCSADEYRPVDISAEKILKEMMGRPGPVVLECQREMVEQGRKYCDIQAALLYDVQTREGLDENQAQHDHINSEIRVLQETENRAQREYEEMVRLRTDEEKRIEEKRIESQRRQREAEAEAEQEIKLRNEKAMRKMEDSGKREEGKEIKQPLKTAGGAVHAQIQPTPLEAAMKKNKELEEKLAEERKAFLDREAQIRKEREDLKKSQAAWEAAKAREAAKAQEARRARLEAEALKEKRRVAFQRAQLLKQEIKSIESSPGWTPRYIIYNKTEVAVHIRACTIIPEGIGANFENDIKPSTLRALHCGPGSYHFEVYVSTQNNHFKTVNQVMGSLAWITAALAVIATAASLPVLLGALVGLPSAFALGGLYSTLLVFVQGKGAGVPPTDYQQTGFKSNVLTGEDRSVLVTSEPRATLNQLAELQMLIIEATRKGKSLYLRYSDPFSLWRTTRLEITGGPSSSQMIWPDATKYTRYHFTASTKAVDISRVGKFEEAESAAQAS